MTWSNLSRPIACQVLLQIAEELKLRSTINFEIAPPTDEFMQ